jgi:hypothetical protein
VLNEGPFSRPGYFILNVVAVTVRILIVMLIVMLIVITMVIFGYSTIIKKECLSFSSIKLFERLDRKFIT